VAERRTGHHAALVGDFNARPGSRTYAQVLDAGLVDAFAEHRKRPWATARFGPRRMHIDHVFSDPDADWVDFDDHHIDTPGPLHGLSDHAPKAGRIRL